MQDLRSTQVLEGIPEIQTKEGERPGVSSEVTSRALARGKGKLRKNKMRLGISSKELPYHDEGGTLGYADMVSHVQLYPNGRS
ncbi:hypothetical protein Tco_0286187 [Tanacetum coccineum]